MKKFVSLFLALLMSLACIGAMAEALPETNELTIYHSNPTDWADPMIALFTEKTGIAVNVVTGSTGDLAAKIVAESANMQADILWGGAPVTYSSIADYMQPYESSEIGNLMEYCIDKNHKWQGFDIAPHVIIYNTNLVTDEEAPKSWEDLLDEKWKGQISQADPTSSSTALCISMIQLQAFGGEDGGYDYMTKFFNNLDGKISASSANVYKMVAEGEFAIGVTYEFPVLDYIQSGQPVNIIYPSEGTYCSPTAFAIIAGGPNQANAQKFVDFLQGSEIQSSLSSLLKRSIRTDLEPTDNMLAMDLIPKMDYDEDWVAEHRSEFTDFWKDLVTG